VPFPSPPWFLHGHMWLSLFPVTSGTPDRPAGLYGVAFVDYKPGSALTYQELLVARLVRDGAVPRVSITDIWVNSEASRVGGRSLWSIPKETANLHISDHSTRPVARTSCDASVVGSPVAAARITAPQVPSLRTPVRFSVSQPPLEQDGDCGKHGGRVDDDRLQVTGVTGSAKTLPCLTTWDFGDTGPLAWLRGRRSVLSLRLSDFRLTFGG
jgi:hypothetical protein